MTTPDVFTPIEQLIDSMPHCVPPVHRGSRFLARLDAWTTTAWCWAADRLIPSPALTSLPPPRAGQPAGRLVEPEPPGSEPAGTPRQYCPNCILDALPWHHCRNQQGELVGPSERCWQSDYDLAIFAQFEKDHPQWG